MSQENVEIVRKSLEAISGFMRGDLSREELAEAFDPQIEMHWGDERTLPDFPQHLAGAPDNLEAMDQMRSAWDDLCVEPLEVKLVPDGRVLTLNRLSGRGRESGVPIVIHYFQLSTIQTGRVGKGEIFRHRADALEAAGLEE